MSTNQDLELVANSLAKLCKAKVKTKRLESRYTRGGNDCTLWIGNAKVSMTGAGANAIIKISQSTDMYSHNTFDMWSRNLPPVTFDALVLLEAITKAAAVCPDELEDVMPSGLEDLLQEIVEMGDGVDRLTKERSKNGEVAYLKFRMMNDNKVSESEPAAPSMTAI